ncbi:hypothetical protein C8J56DRAFT_918855 [Mycena floridula]|nr:hypothetical protein C8J56DRAFT_918855 [Mycena floridula]
MTVKGLVERFESGPTSPEPSITSRRQSGRSPIPSQPRPARFISSPTHIQDGTDPGLPPNRHPLLKISRDDHDIVTSRLSNDNYTQADSTVVDGSKDDYYLDNDTETLLSHSKYPPHNTQPHIPIPATRIFARHSERLYLPKLDDYLARITVPKFYQEAGKGKESVMFPPMDKLALTGQSLEELERNSKVLPAWRNRTTLLGVVVNAFIGLLGSSALATYYSLQGLANTVQIFALILSTIVPMKGSDVGNRWRKLFLGTIPNIVALNFASTVIQSLIFLAIFAALALALLYHFYRRVVDCQRYNRIEGLQQVKPYGQQWGLVVTTFLLTIIYLPLSTMAIHVLVWSQEMWPIPNPYINATSNPPILPPLGPASEFRDPLDFCWTTTMKRNEINFAPAVIILSAIVFFSFTVSFPITLHRVIAQAVPKVDPFNELGRPRNTVDLDNEYHRLLSRDLNPFAFLYNGYRRKWGTYQAISLFAKLSTLVIIAFIDPDNCLFRNLSRSTVVIIRQALLLVSTVGFFLAQCFFTPFLDPVSNASEWVSRLNYLTTALVAMLLALNVPGQNILNGYALYIIYITTYGLSFYFTIINQSWMHRAVKRLVRRIDFSIDTFSPRLDLSITSPHLKRRIWQESITTLFLTSPECKIPKKQRMIYAQARDSVYPPYLLDFGGTPAERHVENLKILREVGSMSYNKAVALVAGPDYAWYRRLDEEIQKRYIGPDCYWKDPKVTSTLYGSHFGNAWWVPFPPTLVIRYDAGPFVVLQDATDLESYIFQNSSRKVLRKREIRMALRALEGQVVEWPFDHNTPIGTQLSWNRYRARSSRHYQTCVVRIDRQGHLSWGGLALGSGFEVKLSYDKKVQVDSDLIGLDEDFDLTSTLARFLSLNRHIVTKRLAQIEETLASYRRHRLEECRHKQDVLTYRFLTHVYDQPQDPTTLASSCIDPERDDRVRRLLTGNELSLEAAYERFAAVSRCETSAWWYLFWDDLWRRNHDTIAGLQLHAADFNPHYPTSIAYMPLPRAALEAFLIQRGLLSKIPRSRDFFHCGFLNKIYLRLNDTVFHKSNGKIFFHVGYDPSEMDMESVDRERISGPSSLGTGGGTDHDNSSIVNRPTYRWEGLLDDPLRKTKGRRFLVKLGTWMGLTPLWRSEMPSRGIALDVRLDKDRGMWVMD